MKTIFILLLALSIPIFQSINCGENVNNKKITSLEKKDVQPIVIRNNITDQMLTYKHWTGKYKPTEFIMTVNGTEIKQNEQLSINSQEKELRIRYDYSFMNGYRTGAREVMCTPNNDAKTISMSFSWSNDHHLSIENATIISDEKVLIDNKKFSKRKKAK